MILVDTSAWIDFFRGAAGQGALVGPIRDGLVLVHPWVLAEIALGSLGARRRAVLADLACFPAAPVVAVTELLAFVEHHSLGGTGIGLVDVQLLASARLAKAELVTSDRRLLAAWRRLSSLEGDGS
jgi:predicted nucleic acid-binding protein